MRNQKCVREISRNVEGKGEGIGKEREKVVKSAANHGVGTGYQSDLLDY